VAQYRIDTNDYLNDGRTIFEVVMMADQDGNIVNSFGPASNIIIASGDLAGYQGVNKYGSVYGTALGTMSTVWTAADTNATALYDWTYSAGPVTVVSSSGSDITDVTVEGLDENYNFAEETFTLTGATPTAAGAVNFARVNRAFMNTATNIGKIQVKRSTTVVTEIGAGFGQTLQCFYTIPAGKTGYMFNLSASASKNQVVDLFLFQRPFGGAFRVQATMSLNQGNQQLDYPSPVKFTEKTDIDLRTRGSSNATISADFTIILVDNSV